MNEAKKILFWTDDLCYIEDGLVHMYDISLHNDAQLDDLIGDMPLKIAGQQYNWTDQCLHINGADTPFTYLFTTSFDGNAFNGHTIQIVARWHKTASGQYGRFICLRNGNNAPCEIMIDKNADNGIGTLRFGYYDGQLNANADVAECDMTNIFCATGIYDKTHKCIYGFFNKSKTQVVNNVEYKLQYPTKLVVSSNEYGYVNCGVEIDIFSIRIYSRDLTDEEVFHNVCIDRRRFMTYE